MQNIQRKTDRITQRGTVFISQAIAGKRIKEWEKFFSQSGISLPPPIAIKDADEELADELVIKGVKDLLLIILQIPFPLILRPNRETADAIQKCLITPRLTAAIIKRIARLGGTGVAGASPYISIKNRAEIAEPYYLLLLDIAAELEAKGLRPHPDSVLGKAARSYNKAVALPARVMQQRTNGQRTGYECSKEQVPAR